jgi:hypothetical protein
VAVASRLSADTPPTAASAAGDSAAHTAVTATKARVPFFFSPAPIRFLQSTIEIAPANLEIEARPDNEARGRPGVG